MLEQLLRINIRGSCETVLLKHNIGKSDALYTTIHVIWFMGKSVGRCGVVGSTLAFGSIGHGFESEHSLFSHHVASAFRKLRSLAKCSLDDSVRRLL